MKLMIKIYFYLGLKWFKSIN